MAPRASFRHVSRIIRWSELLTIGIRFSARLSQHRRRDAWCGWIIDAWVRRRNFDVKEIHYRRRSIEKPFPRGDKIRINSPQSETPWLCSTRGDEMYAGAHRPNAPGQSVREAHVIPELRTSCEPPNILLMEEIYFWRGIIQSRCHENEVRTRERLLIGTSDWCSGSD